MSIEFRCTSCGRLMRTADDTAGKHAKCPACGAAFTIPAAGTTAGEGLPPVQPPAGPPPVMPGPTPAPSPGAGANPYQSPSAYPAAAPVQAAGAVHSTRLDIGDVLRTTWEIFKVEWGTCLAAGILVWLTIAIAIAVLAGGPFMLLFSVSPFLAMVAGFCGYLVALVFAAWLGCGAIRYFLMVARGDRPEMGELFRGGPQFVTVLLTGLLLSVAFMAVHMVAAAPGFVLAFVSPKMGLLLMGLGRFVASVVIWVASLMFSQAYFLIIERNAGVLESLQLSRQITEGNKISLLIVSIVMAVIFFVSLLPCGLGLFVSIPFAILLWPVMYLRMTGQPVAGGR